jgi:hypothetical protein
MPGQISMLNERAGNSFAAISWQLQQNDFDEGRNKPHNPDVSCVHWLYWKGLAFVTISGRQPIKELRMAVSCRSRQMPPHHCTWPFWDPRYLITPPGHSTRSKETLFLARHRTHIPAYLRVKMGPHPFSFTKSSGYGLSVAVSILYAMGLSNATLVYRDGEPCKVFPGDKEWPNDSVWASFNRTVRGALIKTVPHAAVCHSSWPQYNAAECDYLYNNWGTNDIR